MPDSDFIEEEVTPEEIDLAPDTLTGDLRDSIIAIISRMDKTYDGLSEAEQENMIYAVTEVAKRLVKQTAEILAAKGRTTIAATVEKADIKEVIKTVVITPNIKEIRDVLCQGKGKRILLVDADVEPYQGERTPAEATPDQPDLDLEEELKEENPTVQSEAA